MGRVLGTALTALVFGGSVASDTAIVSASDEPTYPRINQLEERFLQPDGFQWGHYTNREQANIRFGWIEPEGEPRAIVLLMPGRAASIEKYFEPIRDLLSRGFAVWSMDWRGQGGSERYLDNPQKGYSLGFEHDVADLHQFVTRVVTPRGRPLVLFAGSMGGHISLRYLHDHPKTFDFAVLVSPMLDIKPGNWPRWLARSLAMLATGCGFGESYIPGGGDWQSDTKNLSASRKNSSDPVRYSVMHTYFREQPELRLGSPTYRWLDVVFDSIAIVSEPAYLKTIHTPLLITSSLADLEVVPEAQERACDLMPNCRLLSVPGARHDLYMERDEFRDQLFDAFDQFAREMLGD